MKNPVARWQIITKDPENHSAFYREVFGWEISADNPLNYRQATSGRDASPDGGFWPAPPEAPSFVQLHVQVEDVPAAVGRATEHGAEVIVPAQHLPDGEVMAVLRDSHGLPFAVFSSQAPG